MLQSSRSVRRSPQTLTKVIAGALVFLAVVIIASRAMPFVMAPSAHAESQAQRPLGADRVYKWSNVRVTQGEDPHAYGLDLELWRHNGAVFGYVMEYAGPAFDAPMARLNSIQFDDATRRISFRTRISTGLTSSSVTKSYVPANSLYEFTGVVGDTAITGTLRRTSLSADNQGRVVEEQIALRSSDPSGSGGAVRDSFERWLEQKESMLRFRARMFDNDNAPKTVQLLLSVAAQPIAAGAPPVLQLRVRNAGTDTISFAGYWMSTENTQFEIDGVWYYAGPRGGGSASEAKLAPGAISGALTLSLRNGLYELGAQPALSRTLTLQPGMHMVRVKTSLSSRLTEAYVSEAITIEIK